MKALAVLLALAGVAEAGHHHYCNGPEVVGYCSHYGGWSWGAAMWWEAGAAMLRYSPKLIDAAANVGTTQYHVTAAPGDPRELTAAGARLRSHMGLGRRFYLGAEFTFAPVTSGPHLVANISARGMTSTMDTGTGGTIMQNFMFFGYHARRGPFSIGAEIGPGVRFASYTTTDLPDPIHPPMQAWLQIEVQPKLDLWLAPNYSLSLATAFDLLHPDSYGAAILLGAHLVPYDGAH